MSAATRRRLPRPHSQRFGRAGSTAPPRHAAPRRAIAPPTALSLVRLLLLPIASAAPLGIWPASEARVAEDAPKSPADASMWVYIGVALLLVLLGGAFAGLTIAFMGQDETYLQVQLLSSESEADKKNAAKVLSVLEKGKHWVLVTLLLSNTITNETLPIVLDRSIGGGWPAVASSTALIVIFGEIVPQSVCVRYGLSIGAKMSPLVLALMWILSPVAWPTAKLLDWAIGQDHGVVYKKAGLKTLVHLHRSIGTTADRLMEDEVNIINSVLDLKEKAVGDVMTPMEDVFTMSADTVLDEKMMDTILFQGYSRIPVHTPDNKTSFIGMLLVKTLITYDPEDCMRVQDFALATLPETSPETSCLDIINYFQEGKSHMVLVSESPGTDNGAIGVVTLEDVIEELIGEEIVDESDVFVDVHKAIRRLAPADLKRFKMRAGRLVEDEGHVSEHERDNRADSDSAALVSKPESRTSSLANGKPQSLAPSTTFRIRRRSSNTSDSAADSDQPIGTRDRAAEIREHLKHLGPSNAASKPKPTRYTSVKIKPGVGTIPENRATTMGINRPERSASFDARPADEANETTTLLNKHGDGASDGVAALRASYGANEGGDGAHHDGPTDLSKLTAEEASKLARGHTATQTTATGLNDHSPTRGGFLEVPDKSAVHSEEDGDSVGEIGTPSRDRSKNRRPARSGSITETTVDVGGVKKIVLETNSSSDEDSPTEATHHNQLSLIDDDDASTGTAHKDAEHHEQDGEQHQQGGSKSKKKKSKKKKKHGKGDGH